MSEFVHHHIVYDNKIGSHKTAAIVKKNIERGEGQCCVPAYSKKQAMLWGGMSVVHLASIIAIGFPLGLIFIITLIASIGYAGHFYRELKAAKPYMHEGSQAIICLGSEDSSATSSAPWVESSGLSKPWAEFIKACRRYEKLLTKMPERDLIADQMFYATVADIYELFEHTHYTSESLSKSQMQLEFQALQDKITKFKTFVDRSSEIYASLRFNQTDKILDVIDSNLDHMNETALTKIQGLTELANPRRKEEQLIALDSGDEDGDVPKKAVVKKKPEARIVT